jgi:glycosyltransferase involved in cell wall biosynthesis
MKLIFFSRLFYPHIGGVEKHVLEISKHLIKRNHQITVFTEQFDSLPVIDNLDGINIIRINAGNNEHFKKFKIWVGLFKYISLIKSADIIHCHDIFFWYLPFKFIFPNKKVYVTFHGYEANETPNIKSIFMHKISEKLSNGNICIGGFFNKWYKTYPSLIAFGAVDKNLIKQGIKNINSNKEAMFLGRLEDEAGIMIYLDVVRKLGISLEIFGNGSLEKKVKEYIKKYNLNVKMHGFVFNATDYIKDYKYIFTSRYLGILEAMALKKPVFSEYNKKIKEDYLKMTPFSKYISISPNAEEMIVEVNKYIKGKSNINVNKAYDWVKDKTWEKMTDNYLNLWKKDK